MRRPHRFIPARAGNTGHCRGPRPTSPVHPRSRGEHSDMPGHAGAFAGSSPLARGTRCPELIPPHFYRFIPARAGNTRAPRIRAPSAPVHPRSRGEHHEGEAGHQSTSGSSPLARGTRVAVHPLELHRRFIPARAGNTIVSSVTLASTAVHPRSRGEHRVRSVDRSANNGSSPLARGTHRRAHLRHGLLRFIPARAGNTEWRWSAQRRTTVHPRSRGEHGTPR